MNIALEILLNPFAFVMWFYLALFVWAWVSPAENN